MHWVGVQAAGYKVFGQTLNGWRGVATGSLVLILVWTWFACQVVFLGAESAQVYARRHGRQIRPEPHAKRTGRAARA